MHSRVSPSTAAGPSQGPIGADINQMAVDVAHGVLVHMLCCCSAVCGYDNVFVYVQQCVLCAGSAAHCGPVAMHVLVGL